MKQSIALTLIFCLLSGYSFAQSNFRARAYTPEFQCPETHPEYTRLLKDLREFQSKLKSQAECTDLEADFSSFTGLLTDRREGFLNIINRNEDGILSVDAVEEIQGYSSDVTEQVSTLISLISNADGGGGLFRKTGCTLEEEDRFAAIQRVTSAAYEVSKLISKVAGPYGVPISIAANTAFGVIQGLQSFIEKSEPIDFDQPEKREFFAESLCLFSSFEAEIKTLINPDGHRKSLLEVRENALQAINQIRLLCPNCTDIIDYQVIDYDSNELNEAQNKELLDLVFKVNQTEGSIHQLGSKSIEAKESLEWVDEEIAKINSIIDFPTTGIGPRELESIKGILSDFLVKTASPGFLRWYQRKANDGLKATNISITHAFNKMRNDLRKAELSFDVFLPEDSANIYGPQGYHFYDLDVVYLYFMNTSIEKMSFGPSYLSALREVFNDWKLTELNAGIVDEYCNFFAKNFLYPDQVSRPCESHNRRQTDAEIAYKAFFLADIVESIKELSIVGPFDFSLDKHIKNFPQEFEGVFLDTQRLIFDSVNGNSMNLRTDDRDSDQNLFPNWQEASEAHVDDLVRSFRAAQTRSNSNSDSSPDTNFPFFPDAPF